jgi:putative protease
LDYEFLKILEKDTAERKIAVDFSLSETPNGFSLNATDEDGNEVSLSFEAKKEKAQHTEKAAENIKTQLSKLGNTDFYAKNVVLPIIGIAGQARNDKECFFIPNSLLTENRRQIIEKLAEKRREAFLSKKGIAELNRTTHPYPITRSVSAVRLRSLTAVEMSYLGNVHNQKAAEFYRQHGVADIAPSFETQQPNNVPVMFAKHCLRFSFGLCPKMGAKNISPLYLMYKNEKLRLDFDCEKCEMQVIV